jgi:thioesterase domain-containing protein
MQSLIGRFRGAFLALAVAFLAAGPAQVFAATGDGKPPSGKGIVYLLRGGFDVFSTGMDELAEKLRERGIDARTLGQAGWKEAAAEAAERYKTRRAPVVLIGHSFGANAAVLMAGALGEKRIPVSLMVLFDPTEALKAPVNVRRLLNFLSLDMTGFDFHVFATPGFHGTLDNILHTELNHLSIDNDPALQKQTLEEVVKAVGGGRRAAAE